MNFFKERFNYKLTVYALLILLMIGIGLGALRLYLLHEAFHAHTESLLQVEKKLALLSGIDHFASIPSIEGKLSYRDASPLLLQIQNAFSLLKKTLSPSDRIAQRFYSQALGSWMDYIKLSSTPEAEKRELKIKLEETRQELRQLKATLALRKDKASESMLGILLGISTCALLIAFAILGVHRWLFLVPLKRLEGYSKALANGELPTVPQSVGKDFDLIVQWLHSIAERNKNIITYIQYLGDRENRRDLLPIGEKDKINSAIVQAGEKLHVFFEQDKKRSWINQGLANFADIQQKYSNDIKVLTEKVTAGLVEYVGASQGGIFIRRDVEEDEQHAKYELLAMYAWDRKRYLSHDFEAGEGLIGEVALSGQTHYLTDVPDDFYLIESGMGASKPSAVLVVPLKANGSTQGVLELAAFKEFEEHERHFIDELANSLAVSISITQSNMKTRELLTDSIGLTKQMASQEDMMRQNMQMLLQTQKEMVAKDAELKGLLASIDSNMILLEIGLKGDVKHANENFCQLVDLNSRAIVGKHFQKFINLSNNNQSFWREMNLGAQLKRTVICLAADGSEKWVEAIFAPILNDKKRLVKITMIGRDITTYKYNKDEERLISLVMSNTEKVVIVTDENGFVEYTNAAFEKTTGYTTKEVLGKKPGELLQGRDTDKATKLQLREALKKQQSICVDILNYTKAGKKYWITLNINPVFTKMGRLIKFVAIQTDITQAKLLKQEHDQFIGLISEFSCMVEYSTSGKIVFMNAPLQEVLGVAFTDWEGRERSELIEGPPDFTEILAQLKISQNVRGVFLVRTPNGGSLQLQSVLSLVTDLEGKPKKIVELLQIRQAKRGHELLAKKL